MTTHSSYTALSRERTSEPNQFFQCHDTVHTNHDFIRLLSCRVVAFLHFSYYRTLVCIGVQVMMSYHQHMLQQSQISISAFFAVTQSSHLDIFVDLWVVGSLLKPQTDNSLHYYGNCYLSGGNTA